MTECELVGDWVRPLAAPDAVAAATSPDADGTSVAVTFSVMAARTVSSERCDWVLTRSTRASVTAENAAAAAGTATLDRGFAADGATSYPPHQSPNGRSAKYRDATSRAN